MTTVEFLWDNLGQVDKNITKLMKRASKMNIPFTVSRSREITRRHEITSGPQRGQILQFGEVSYSIPTFSLPDWRLLGVLTPIPTETGETITLATAVPGTELPEDVREWELRCDHCMMNRNRKETFLVQHTSSEIRQVGRQCIRDYLGHDAERIFSWFDFVRDFLSDSQTWGINNSHSIGTYSLKHVLSATSAIIKNNGWKSRKVALETMSISTSDLVMKHLLEVSHSADEFRRENPISEEDERIAEECVEFWKSEYNDLSDYVQNARLLAEHNVVIKKAFGLAVSLLPVWQKRIADKQEYTSRVNEYVGEVGERRDFMVSLVSRRPIESAWGIKYLVTFRDTEGRSLIWWATSGSGTLTDAGDSFSIKGTIKEHKEYKGTRQTILSRVILIK